MYICNNIPLIFLRMGNVSDSMCRENQNMFTANNIFFIEIHAVCEIM